MVSLRRMGHPELASLPPQARILCLRLSALGDIVFALPALHALRQALPEAEIHWLTEDRHASLLAGHPHIDQLHQFPRKSWRMGRGLGPMWSHFRGLREGGRFDLVFDFQGNLKSALQEVFIPSKHKIGFDAPIAREGSQRFLDHRISVEARTARYRRDLALVEACGWSGTPPLRHRWPLAAEAEQAMAGTLTDGTILLHTTTTDYGRDKAWAQASWRRLACLLLEQGHTLRLLWTAAEEPEVHAHVEAVHDFMGADADIALAPATTSLAHLMALLDQAKGFIGTDSGPLHLGAYRGTPVVGLFGATDPLIYTPPGEQVRVVYGGEEGEAPPPRDRSRRSPWMDRIAPEAVVDALDELLRAQS